MLGLTLAARAVMILWVLEERVDDEGLVDYVDGLVHQLLGQRHHLERAEVRARIGCRRGHAST